MATETIPRSRLAPRVGSASACDDRWRYIRYSDGTQELYDLKNDPQEWSNLAAEPSTEASTAMKRLGDAMPKTFAKAIARHKGKYEKATGLDRTIKATRNLAKLK